MDTASALGLLAVLALVLFNGFFVAAEFAIVAVRRSRLEQLAREGRASARLAQDIVQHLDLYVAACQLGITMASLALGWVGEPALAHLIEPPLVLLVGEASAALSHGIATGLAFAVITTFHIVLGELAPKGMALQSPEGTALWVARPLQLFQIVFKWPINALNATGNGVLRVLGKQSAAGHEMVHSVEELRLLVTSSREAGVVEEAEARIAHRAFAFADITAAGLMTPRTELQALPIDVDLPTLRAQLATGTHSRLPVYQGSLDDIVGVLHVLDMFKLADGAAFDLQKLLRPAFFVPEPKPADELLEDMRRAHEHFAIVVDEFGGTAGAVSLEDLTEALVGRMQDRQDVTDNGDPLHALPDGSLLLQGLMRLVDMEEAVGMAFSEEDHHEAETLGGVVMRHLGRIAQQGDEIEIAGRTLRVEVMDGKRIQAVRMLP